LKFIEANPDHGEAIGLLGMLYLQLDRPADAARVLRNAVAQTPQSPEIQYNFGLALCANQDWTSAIAAFESAIRLRPDYAPAYNGLGSALRATSQLAPALEAYRKAVELKPQTAGFWNNLGIVLQTLGQSAEGARAFERALTLKPDYADALSNLATAQRMNGRPFQSAQTSRRAIAIQERLPDAWNNLGNALRDCGQIPQAAEAYARAVEFAPRDAGFGSNLVYALHFQSDLDPAEVFRRHLEWNQRYAAPLATQIRRPGNDRDLNRRLRIGYVSPDFREHSVAYFLVNLFTFHDPAQFEIFAYADVPQPDKVTTRLQQWVAHWRSAVGLSDAILAEMIRNDRIDILVDLAGHTANNRLLVFARKPAPVQITHIGYPYSTGMTAMDYRFTDAYADPPGMTDPFHTEKIIRLPNTFLCFSPPNNAPDVGPLPQAKAGYTTFGSFNSLAKISTATIELWVRLLRAAPTSRLMIKSIGGLAEPEPKKMLLDHFVAGGIEPDRIVLREKLPTGAAHLELYNQIDIALDTYPYHGTKTTCDALWMGVPVISLAGPTHPSRVGVSLLSNVGLPNLVARSPQEYVQKGVELAGNPAKLAQLRAELRGRMSESPLCNGKEFARHIEDAYRQLWAEFCRRSP
ncbi:MAG: tetratricopeptide repeat protein, partial [Tepidisphaeraceae bacterium]